MAQNAVNSKYYALADSEATDCKTASSCNKTSENNVEIFEIKVANGDEDAKYSCTGSVKVTASGSMITDSAGSLQTGDVSIVLTNLLGDEGTEAIDLVSLKDADHSKSSNLKFTIEGNTTKTIKAYVMLENQEAEQDYLAGKELNITLETENVECPAVAAE